MMWAKADASQVAVMGLDKALAFAGMLIRFDGI